MTKVSSVIIGTLAGFVAGILLAPKSGKETIEDLKYKGQQLKKSAADNYEVIGNDVKEGVQSIKSIAQKSAENIKDSFDESSDVVKDTSKSVKRNADKAADDLKHRM